MTLISKAEAYQQKKPPAPASASAPCPSILTGSSSTPTTSGTKNRSLPCFLTIWQTFTVIWLKVSTTGPKGILAKHVWIGLKAIPFTGTGTPSAPFQPLSTISWVILPIRSWQIDRTGKRTNFPPDPTGIAACSRGSSASGHPRIRNEMASHPGRDGSKLRHALDPHLALVSHRLCGEEPREPHRSILEGETPWIPRRSRSWIGWNSPGGWRCGRSCPSPCRIEADASSLRFHA